MEIKIKINDKVTMLVEVEQEMTIAEFMGVTSLIAKIDKYALNQKQVVSEIRGTGKVRKMLPKLSWKEKKERVEEWDNADKDQKTEIAKKYDEDKDSYTKKMYYFKKVINGK